MRVCNTQPDFQSRGSSSSRYSDAVHWLATGTHHNVLDVIGAHPLARWHGSEGWIEAVHVEQERAVITLNQRGDPAAPEGR